MALKKALSPFILFVFFASMLFIQMHLKTMPVIVLFSITSAIILLFVFHQNGIASMLLCFMILFFGFCFWFMICMLIKNLMFPRPPFNGVYVPDTSWVYCIPIGIVLSIVAAVLYFKKAERVKKIEMYSLIAYLAGIVIVFCYKKMRYM